MIACRIRPYPLLLAMALLLGFGAAAQALDLKEPPMLAAEVAAGKLPPVSERVPAEPLVVKLDGKGESIGRYGGDLRMLIGRAKDVRYLTVYSYARLVAYDRKFELQPDILESIKIDDDRSFTMKLRKGHKWSDGEPFTTEDFRYWWEDVANNPDLTPSGPPKELFVDGEKAKVEIIDATTLRYSWSKPNPFFLPRLAGASPLYIYRPAHYMKKFHARYSDAAALQKLAEENNKRNWAALHNSMDNMYDDDNPDLPTLDPWRITTRPPANRFIAVRNPYYFKVDASGQQLPYIDRVAMSPAAAGLIAAKAGAGEADLQARGLSFANFTFLKENEERSGYQTFLWRTAKGSHFALYPNLNCNDPVWRALFRDVRFRRAMSLGIDRDSINQSLFFGLAIEGNNTALPDSPLFREENLTKWAKFDAKAANRLLDELGLTKRNDEGFRLLPDGRTAEIVVETAGEDTEQTDILELIRESWKSIGLKLLSKPSQREVMRNRVFSGDTLMSVWEGFENGLPTADMSPAELAPTSQLGLEWPKWGQYYETKGQAGDKIDMPLPQELFDLNQQWLHASSKSEREKIWLQMLTIHADQQFTIGVVGGVQQPVVVNKRLRNIPKEAVYNWDPGANFGIYHPDTFWFDAKGK